MTYDHEQWLAARRHGIGASEAAAAVGMSPYTSRLELWHRKRPDWDPALDPPPNRYMYWGSQIEPVVRQHVANAYGVEVTWRPFNLVQHATIPWMLATPDGELELNERIREAAEIGGVNLDDLEPGAPGLLEVKLASDRAAPQWEDGPPDHYEIQVRHQMAVCNVDWAMVAVLIGGCDDRQFILRRDPEAEEGLIDMEREFWDLVERREPPEPDAGPCLSKFLARLYPRDNGRRVELPFESTRWDDLRQQAIELADRAKTMRDESEDWLKSHIGEAAFGALPDGTVYSWKQQERAPKCCPKCGTEVLGGSTFRVLRRKAPSTKAR